MSIAPNYSFDLGPRTSDLGRRVSLSLAMLLVLGACSAPPRDLSGDEAKRIAWWCEDWSHGIPRDVGELRTDDASAGLLRIADWAAAAETSSAKHHLRQRRQRWPVVQGLLRSGILVSTEEGLLALAPGQVGDTANLAQAVADSENQDRRTVEVLCLTMAQTDERMTPALKRAFAEARRADDLAATPELTQP
jgi:hypothetical protein